MDWQRLAQAIIDRRVEQGFRTRGALVKHSGMSLRVLADLETAARTNYDPVTIARLEKALEWPAGRVRELLRDTPERLTIDEYSGAMLDTTGRELAPELCDLIHFMRPDSGLDDDAREAAQKLLYGTVMALAALARKSRKVRELAGEPEDDYDPGVEVPDQGTPHYLDRVEGVPEAVDVTVQLYQPRESTPRGAGRS